MRLSGAASGRFGGDLKARADGFCEPYSWLTKRDVLIVKADRQEPLVFVRLSPAEIVELVA